MKRAHLSIMIDSDLKERLKEIADRQNRNLSNLVETELKRVVATEEATRTEQKPIPQNPGDYA